MLLTKKKDCLELRYEGVYSGFNVQALLLSDTHIDNPKAKRKHLKEHMERAAQKRCPIFLFGDVFDAIRKFYIFS